MMASLARLLLGLVLLPACWGSVRVFFDCLVSAAGADEVFTTETISLFGGMMAFALCWMTISHPIRAYVLGHELTHALWGLFFGARPSDVRVSASGGSVRLTKSNFLITLAPYFFPFYTFLVIVVALITYAFLRPLPFLPLWMFLIGFTWAFHILFTLQTLCERQPDVKLYGRVFSWTFIFLVNILMVLGWLVVTTPLAFEALRASACTRMTGAYVGTATAFVAAFRWVMARFGS